MNTPRARKTPLIYKLILALMILLPIVGSAWFLFSLRQAISTTTDPAEYDQAYAVLPDSALPVFPSAIPSDATHVVFYYRRHLAPGGVMIQLRLNPGSSFEEMHEEITSFAAHLAGRDESSQPATQLARPAVAIRMEDNKGFEDLPADFQVWYEAETAAEPGGPPGMTLVVAGSKQRNQVVYSYHE